MKQVLADAEATEAFGAELWRCLPSKSLIFLQGDLGAGKTTLVRGFLRAAGYKGNVKSPTYTLVESYTINARIIHHFDLYRLNDPEELEWIGIADYFDQDAICFIEWPDKGQGFLPRPDAIIYLSYQGERRLLEIDSINLKFIFEKQ